MMETAEAEGRDARLLDKKPPLCEAGMPYWEAFQELADQRPIGGMGGSGAIRREAVSDWLTEHRIFESSEREAYRYYLRVLDSTWLEFQNERMESEVPKASKLSRGTR